MKIYIHFTCILGPTLNNFVYVHYMYTHPNIVLHCDNGNVSLLDITPTDVCFCITDHNIDVYDVSR